MGTHPIFESDFDCLTDLSHGNWFVKENFEEKFRGKNFEKMVEMRNLFGTIARSTSAPAGYDQIDDTSEGRLKVHAEEAFKAGIKFKARFIGSLEIPKPHSRVEIVAAMRRVRYEFKARSTKKKKVEILVSVDGVRVTLRQSKKKKENILQE